MTWVGQHTLGIFLPHKNIQMDLIILWIHTWLAGSQLLVACISTCISFVPALMLCTVIKMSVPKLQGQFSRYPEKSRLKNNGRRRTKGIKGMKREK